MNEEGQVVDEEGNLILDEAGNPMTLEDLQNGGAAQAELSEDEVCAGGVVVVLLVVVVMVVEDGGGG